MTATLPSVTQAQTKILDGPERGPFVRNVMIQFFVVGIFGRCCCCYHRIILRPYVIQGWDFQGMTFHQ